MKKIIVLLVGILYLLGGLVLADSTRNAVESVELSTGIEGTDMYTNIYNYDMLRSLESICSDTDYAKWLSYVETGKSILNRRYLTTNSAETLLHSYDLYEKLQDIQFGAASKYEWSKYCRIKIFLYGLMQYLREANIEVMKETGIINDFDGYDGPTINGLQTKIATLQKHNSTYALYSAMLGAGFTYSYDDQGFFDSLTTQQKALLSEIEQLMKHMLSYSVYRLQQDGVLDQTDINELREKMNIEYGTACNLFHGRYEIKQTLDNKGNHIRYDTQQFTIKVNLCPSYFVIRDMPKIFQRIITHELAHHVYYYKDQWREDFKSICWESADTQHGRCGEGDFVSPYAQSLAVEDYADHFMHWYLDLIDKDSYYIREKTGHFEDLFPQI